MITQKQKVNLVSSLEYDGFEFTIINHPKGLEAVKDDKLQKLFANYRSIVKQIKTHMIRLFKRSKKRIVSNVSRLNEYWRSCLPPRIFS